MNDKKAIDIRTHLNEIIPEIFRNLLSIEVESTDNKPPKLSEKKYLVGTIDFTGDATGILSIRVTPAFARRMTAVGDDQESEQIENNEKIQNLLAEILNKAGETLNAVLAEVGFLCEPSTALISTSTDARMDPADLEIYEQLVFRNAEDTIFVEMGLNLSGQLQPQKEPQNEVHQKAGDRQSAQGKVKSVTDFGLELILDIPIELTVELGRTKIQIHELLKLGPGSAIPLTKLEGEPVDILANDTLVARGQVVVQDEKYGIRVTEITSRMDRIKSLN